eukprot:TRINITY_DN3343_c0_g1_i2.p2 TRINITY_DN3343_c0_g1~~TRINITY_DN3343_c0_g1_i2.p2  ORF type:complete len:150 (+),score=34.59 TRINITY_DN3343_c0_g1_i2:304-753(+)
MDQSKEVNFVRITHELLNIEEVVQLVSCDDGGAVSSFIGTTRNNFQGKRVIELEYEAYETMAYKELEKICASIRMKWPVLKVALFHRLGVVPIGEASVIVAVSSVHRRESLEAVQYGIDELKRMVPIWKKEKYEDGSVWKGNCESCHYH